MKHLFSALPGMVVPDGTTVHDILSPRQLSQDGLRVRDAVSVALGELPAGTRSSIHVHPVVSHFSWVTEGALTVMMKDDESTEPYVLAVPSGHGVMTEPGTFLQLINDSPLSCKMLYIVGPAFTLETSEDGGIAYNDAIVLPHTWAELGRLNWKPPELADCSGFQSARMAALNRMGSVRR